MDRENLETIYLKIMDEDIDVWIPVKAVKIDKNIYKIIEKNDKEVLKIQKFRVR